MTAPDPTAGEREGPCWRSECRTTCCYPAVCLEPASPPAVAASTGTSEDVEALAELIWHNTDEPMWSAMVLAKQFLASDWLAAREAAARAEERERIAQAIEGVIEAHRSAGNRAIVAALAPLPDLAREVRP